MTYEAFTKGLEMELEKRLGEGYQIKETVIRKNNGALKEAVVVIKEGRQAVAARRELL